MIRFATKPDSVFTAFINDSLDMGKDALDIQGVEFDVYWLDENTFKMFGSDPKILINELQKLKAANNSEELFMPTDYHFRLLDRVLNWYCEIYNDDAADSDCLIYSKGKPVDYFDIDDIRSTFFWDNDYELIDMLNSKGKPEEVSAILEIMGVSHSGKNIQKGNLAGLDDLSIKKCTPDENWDEIDEDFWFDGDDDDDYEDE